MSDNAKSDNLLAEKEYDPWVNAALDPTVMILDTTGWSLEWKDEKCKLIRGICLLYLFLPTITACYLKEEVTKSIFQAFCLIDFYNLNDFDYCQV